MKGRDAAADRRTLSDVDYTGDRARISWGKTAAGANHLDHCVGC